MMIATYISVKLPPISVLALSPEDVLPSVYLCTNKIAADHENIVGLTLLYFIPSLAIYITLTRLLWSCINRAGTQHWWKSDLCCIGRSMWNKSVYYEGDV